MSEPQKSRSIQRREAIQRGEEMPTFSGTDNTPDPPAPPISVEQAQKILAQENLLWAQAFGRNDQAVYVAATARRDDAIDALILAVRAEVLRERGQK